MGVVSWYLNDAAASEMCVIRGSAVRPGVSEIDQRIAPELPLQLRLQTVVVRSVDFSESIAAVPADIRPEHVQLVKIPGRNRYCGLSVHGGSETDLVCAAGARRGIGALQVSILCGLIDVDEAGQVDALVAVVTQVENPARGDFSLEVQAPLLAVGILVIDGNPAL